MGLREIDNDRINLIAKQLRMMQGKDMTCFYVIDWRLEQNPGNRVRISEEDHRPNDHLLSD